eukprot:TRINITY_DN1760_c0_g1_i5.p1 TRINITY_DN1760_c0_g1~~TRINITY_DN1760_c0_g1_i5.p1  ORF type:complete len:361 (+),score=104.83 TRINITY_DN1760_c0_g1_i5:1260-2342(+)
MVSTAVLPSVYSTSPEVPSLCCAVPCCAVCCTVCLRCCPLVVPSAAVRCAAASCCAVLCAAVLCAVVLCAVLPSQPTDGITPVLVTLDAHKHLGTDKGLSTVIGTPNTLSRLTGRLPVGVQPGRAVLVAALADMLLIGADGYHTLYHQLAGEVEKAAQAITAAGMTVVHAEGKMPGSTVLAVEDSSGIMTRRLKKKGHSFAYLYNLYPEDPDRCQTGWSLSLTHNSLRELPGGATALDTFVGDLVQVHKSLGVGPCWAHKLWKENSLLGILASGGLVDSWLFGLLWKPGARRSIAEMVIRRFFSAILDSGVVRSNKRTQALKIFLARTAILAMLLLAVLSRRVGGRAALLLGAAVTTVVR